MIIFGAYDAMVITSRIKVLLQVVVNRRSFDISLLKSQMYQGVFFKKTEWNNYPGRILLLRLPAELLPWSSTVNIFPVVIISLILYSAIGGFFFLVKTKIYPCCGGSLRIRLSWAKTLMKCKFFSLKALQILVKILSSEANSSYIQRHSNKPKYCISLLISLILWWK